MGGKPSKGTGKDMRLKANAKQPTTPAVPVASKKAAVRKNPKK